MSIYAASMQWLQRIGRIVLAGSSTHWPVQLKLENAREEISVKNRKIIGLERWTMIIKFYSDCRCLSHISMKNENVNANFKTSMSMKTMKSNEKFFIISFIWLRPTNRCEQGKTNLIWLWRLIIHHLIKISINWFMFMCAERNVLCCDFPLKTTGIKPRRTRDLRDLSSTYY